MADSTSHVAKIKLKVGSMELEYEGAPSFLADGIEALLEQMGDLASKVPTETPPPPAPALDAQEPLGIGNGNGGSSPASDGRLNFSTSTIAAHLDVKTGPELLICALAQLTLVQGKASSTRAEILAEMKSATTHYSKSMSSNMTKILAGLTNAKRINHHSKDIYALNATERKELEAKIAKIC